MNWRRAIEEETNYLVSKGYTWEDVRRMEAPRRSNYVSMNTEIDKKNAEAIKSAMGQHGY